MMGVELQETLILFVSLSKKRTEFFKLVQKPNILVAWITKQYGLLLRPLDKLRYLLTTTISRSSFLLYEYDI